MKLLLKGVGLRARAPRKLSVLDQFFRDSMKIAVPLLWRKALGKDFQDAEKRCIRLQELLVGDPTARIMALDTFNEVLLQAFSQKHPGLSAAYRAAAGSGSHPDFGPWLHHSALLAVLPKGTNRFREIHAIRVAADLAHAKVKKGKTQGRPTKPVSFRRADQLLKKATVAWAELILEWSKLL